MENIPLFLNFFLRLVFSFIAKKKDYPPLFSGSRNRLLPLPFYRVPREKKNTLQLQKKRRFFFMTWLTFLFSLAIGIWLHPNLNAKAQRPRKRQKKRLPGLLPAKRQAQPFPNPNLPTPQLWKKNQDPN
ncbi:Hypothetical protein Minf_2354 [Methylacidiphilum infernorum V4]|uniref:Uncharacterized protein n=1 Tax=Methylacidiphilum infernorum (isolate V4) TaxID=481448 RepID=B3E0H9_METI4|nr:Hypothetical protein Minf_2354 [Methylacidiphilum infernorum V4]